MLERSRIADREGVTDELSTYYLGKFSGSTFNGRGKLVQKDLIYDG
jgi:hypothetical protein